MAREVTGIALPPGERALHEPYLASARSELGDVGWEEALAEGRTSPYVDQAAEYALSSVQTHPTTTSTPEEPQDGEPPNELTGR